MATQFLDEHYLGLTAVVCAGMQTAFFIVAATFKFDKVTDFAGGTNFVVNAVLTLLLGGHFHIRQVSRPRVPVSPRVPARAHAPAFQIVLTAMVATWGLRLSGFLLYRIIKTGKDDRFDEIRDNVLKFAVFWFFQALWVWTVGMPVNVLNAQQSSVPIGVLDYLGWALFAVGLGLEAAADQTKFAFRQDPTNRGQWCTKGVWAWSRHPNYAGEIMLWWGIWLSTVPVWRDAGPSWAWATVVSPVFITLLLLFGSGIPGNESSYDQRFGDREDYWEYLRSVSILWPVPPALYRCLPRALRAVFCCDFPFYRASKDDEASV